MPVLAGDPCSPSPLSLAIRLVQAVDAPDPIGASLIAIGDALVADAVGFYTYNRADSSIRLTHAAPPTVLQPSAVSTHTINDTSIAAQTLRAGTPLCVAPFSPESAVRAAIAGFGVATATNLVSIPIAAGTAHAGVLQMLNIAPGYLGGDETLFAEIGTLFGAMLASAERRNELTTLGAMLSQITQSLDLRATLGAILDGLMTLVPSMSASVYLDSIYPDALARVATRSWGSGALYPTTQPRPLNDSLTGWVYRHHTAALVGDVLADPRVLRSGPDAAPDDAPTRSYIMVPLLVGTEPVGTLVASRREVDAFSADDLRIVEQFAPLAAQAVTNARLYNEAQQARARTETMFEDIADAIILIDRAGITRAWNKGAERLFGYTAAEVIGKYPPLVPLDDNPHTAGLWARVLKGESFSHIENQQPHKDGRLLDTLVSLSPWHEGGEIVGGLGINRDITAIKDLERRLRRETAANERRAQDKVYVAAAAQACNSATDGAAMLQTVAEQTAAWADDARIVTFDAAGRSILAAYASRHGAEDAAIHAQLRATYATGVRVMPMVQAVRERVDTMLEDVRALPLTNPLVIAYRARDYHTKAFVPISAEGEIVGVLIASARADTLPFDAQSVATLELVTEQVGLAITKSRLLRQVQAQVLALEEASRQKDDFLASLSHELRTPLNAILGFGRLIADGLITDPT